MARGAARRHLGVSGGGEITPGTENKQRRRGVKREGPVEGLRQLTESQGLACVYYFVGHSLRTWVERPILSCLFRSPSPAEGYSVDQGHCMGSREIASSWKAGWTIRSYHVLTCEHRGFVEVVDSTFASNKLLLSRTKRVCTTTSGCWIVRCSSPAAHQRETHLLVSTNARVWCWQTARQKNGCQPCQILVHSLQNTFYLSEAGRMYGTVCDIG